MSHTPGPWYVSSTDDGSVASVYSSGYEPYKAVRASRPVERHERVYNADLIASAPDLLHDLRNWISYMGHIRREILDHVWATVPERDQSAMRAEYDGLMALATATIAKAEGVNLMSQCPRCGSAYNSQNGAVGCPECK